MTIVLKGQIIVCCSPPPYSKDRNRKACYTHINDDLNELQEEVRGEPGDDDNSVLGSSCEAWQKCYCDSYILSFAGKWTKILNLFQQPAEQLIVRLRFLVTNHLDIITAGMKTCCSTSASWASEICLWAVAFDLLECDLKPTEVNEKISCFRPHVQ